MDVSPVSTLLLVMTGLGTGVLGAILGTGGGVLIIPVLVLGFGVPMHYAVATSIVSVIATSSAVASANVERGLANMPLGMTLETATALGAIIGGVTAGWLEPRALEALFAVTLIPTAVLMWRGTVRDAGPPEVTTVTGPDGGEAAGRRRSSTDLLAGHYYDPGLGRDVDYPVRRLWAGMSVALVAGNLSGLLGIGGGVFKVPALHLLCGVPIKAAAATSNFMIGVTATASAFLYFGRGEVEPMMTAAIVLGVLAGSAAGSVANRFVGGLAVKRLFAVLLLAVAIQMLIRSLVSQG